MGVSTDGQIGFGVVFEEGYEFPWDKHTSEDIDDWWTEEVLGFKHSFEIYDEKGNYIGGEKPPQETIDRYYKEWSDFRDSHPKVPVELINYCSGDYPMYMLAVPSSCKSNSRGDAEEFDPAALRVTDAEKQTLLDFCKKYKLKYEKGPGWYLTSYWG